MSSKYEVEKQLSDREFILRMFPCVKEGLKILSDPDYETKTQTFDSVEEYESHVFGKSLEELTAEIDAMMELAGGDGEMMGMDIEPPAPQQISPAELEALLADIPDEIIVGGNR
jgi:hypothetical protein